MFHSTAGRVGHVIPDTCTGRLLWFWVYLLLSYFVHKKVDRLQTEGLSRLHMWGKTWLSSSECCTMHQSMCSSQPEAVGCHKGEEGFLAVGCHKGEEGFMAIGFHKGEEEILAVGCHKGKKRIPGYGVPLREKRDSWPWGAPKEKRDS